MRELRRMAWAATIAVATAAAASAQMGGGVGSGTGGLIGNAGTQTSALPTTVGGTNTTATGSTTSAGGGNTSLPGSTANPVSNFTAATPLTAPSKSPANNSAVAASNFAFRNYYGNPFYQGVSITNSPGGFGTAMYPASGAATNARGGARGGGLSTTDPGGQIAGLPRQIAYAAQVQFKLPGGNAMPQLQSDLRGAIDRLPNTMLANPAAVKIDVDGRNVILRGTVRDEDEMHLIEGLVRLTPGVRAITNELTLPK
jgi:hypothetical protein